MRSVADALPACANAELNTRNATEVSVLVQDYERACELTRRLRLSTGIEEPAGRDSGSGQTARTSSFFMALAFPASARSSILAISSASAVITLFIETYLSAAAISATPEASCAAYGKGVRVGRRQWEGRGGACSQFTRASLYPYRDT